MNKFTDRVQWPSTPFLVGSAEYPITDPFNAKMEKSGIAPVGKLHDRIVEVARLAFIGALLLNAWLTVAFEVDASTCPCHAREDTVSAAALA